ncbi:MAG: hypothetical protein HYY06_07655 [Deltaproteobacteria bacterium]|nr:hypothetical protein [Deltaproteobacteria bacterium]
MSRLAVLLVLGIPIPASANPLVDDGLRRLEEADFEGAERAFAAAESASDLTLADLVDLLEARALLHLGLHQPEALDRDLARLASIDPTHVFAPGRPPDLAMAFAAVRSRVTERLHVEADARATATGVSIDVRVVGDIDGLGRQVRIAARTGGGPWQVGAGPGLSVAAAPGTSVEYWAAAIGPGGAELASRGSAAQPLRVTVPGGGPPVPIAASEPPIVGAPAPRDSSVSRERRGSKTWIWLTVSGVVVAIAATAALVYFVRTSETQPTGPSLDF